MRENLKRCIQSVTKFVQIEKQQRKLLDRKRLLDWDQIVEYLNLKAPMKLMDDFRKEKYCTGVTLAYQIQQHLVLYISLVNAKRSGVFVDFSINKFEEAQPEEGGMVALVAEGKTFKSSDAAGLFFSDEEFHLMEIDIENCRPLFHPKDSQVFCTSTGERSLPNDIRKSQKEAMAEFCDWKKVPYSNITSSLIRKTMISVSRKMGLDRCHKADWI